MFTEDYKNQQPQTGTIPNAAKSPDGYQGLVSVDEYRSLFNDHLSTVLWASLALAMLVIIIIIWPHSKKGSPLKIVPASAAKKAVTTNPPLSLIATTIASPTPSSTSSTASNYYHKRKSANSSGLLSYSQAVKTYDGRRIQFDQDCRAFPNQMATANGMTVMLDNRSNETQAIKIGQSVYNVAPYNYVLATLTQKVLPASLLVTCNKQVNTAEFILE